VNETPETTDAEPAAHSAPQDQNPTPSEPVPASVMRAVLAIPVRSYDNDGWAGRILNHAPGPAETARTLHEILSKRHKGRGRVREAISELIYDHSAGWERLGADDATGGTKRRRTEIPLGTCRCHLPDGTPRPGLARAQNQALIAAEWRGEARFTRDPHGQDADGAPQLIQHSQTLDADVAHILLLTGDTIEIHARDNSADRAINKAATVRGFSPAARISAARPLDWNEIGPHLDRVSAELRARPRTDWDRVHAADALTRAAKELERVPPHADLLLYLLGKETGQHSKQAAEGALAEAGGVHSAELPALLLRAPRAEQLRLLREAAYLMDPAQHPAR
jgi:hypothetical protein